MDGKAVARKNVWRGGGGGGGRCKSVATRITCIEAAETSASKANMDVMHGCARSCGGCNSVHAQHIHDTCCTMMS